MVVTCRAESRYFDGATNNYRLDLVPRKAYVVFAIATTARRSQYYVIPESEQDLPLAYDSQLFEVDDPLLPSDWTSKSSGRGPFRRTIESFAQWAHDPTFYERLVDGDAQAAEIMRQKIQEYTA